MQETKRKREMMESSSPEARPKKVQKKSHSPQESNMPTIERSHLKESPLVPVLERAKEDETVVETKNVDASDHEAINNVDKSTGITGMDDAWSMVTEAINSTIEKFSVDVTHGNLKYNDILLSHKEAYMKCDAATDKLHLYWQVFRQAHELGRMVPGVDKELMDIEKGFKLMEEQNEVTANKGFTRKDVIIMKGRTPHKAGKETFDQVCQELHDKVYMSMSRSKKTKFLKELREAFQRHGFKFWGKGPDKEDVADINWTELSADAITRMMSQWFVYRNKKSSHAQVDEEEGDDGDHSGDYCNTLTEKHIVIGRGSRVSDGKKLFIDTYLRPINLTKKDVKVTQCNEMFVQAQKDGFIFVVTSDTKQGKYRVATNKQAINKINTMCRIYFEGPKKDDESKETTSVTPELPPTTQVVSELTATTEEVNELSATTDQAMESEELTETILESTEKTEEVPKSTD